MPLTSGEMPTSPSGACALTFTGLYDYCPLETLAEVLTDELEPLWADFYARCLPPNPHSPTPRTFGLWLAAGDL